MIFDIRVHTHSQNVEQIKCSVHVHKERSVHEFYGQCLNFRLWEKSRGVPCVGSSGEIWLGSMSGVFPQMDSSEAQSTDFSITFYFIVSGHSLHCTVLSHSKHSIGIDRWLQGNRVQVISSFYHNFASCRSINDQTIKTNSRRTIFPKPCTPFPNISPDVMAEHVTVQPIFIEFNFWEVRRLCTMSFLVVWKLWLWLDSQRISFNNFFFSFYIRFLWFCGAISPVFIVFLLSFLDKIP